MERSAEVRVGEVFMLLFLKAVCMLGVLCLCQETEMRKQGPDLRLK